MKIAFALDDSLDKPDGVQQYILTLGNWFRSQGHEVEYLVGQTIRSDIPAVHSLARNIKVRFNQNRMSVPMPANRRRLRELLDAKQYDVIHVQMPYSPFLCGRIITAAPANTAIVATFHILPFSAMERMASRSLAVLTKSTLKRIDAVISVSRPAAEFAQTTFKVRSTVIPNAVDISLFSGNARLPQYKDMFTIVFLGRLVKRKGIMQLLRVIEAKKEILRKHNGKLVVCGKGPLLDEVQKFILQHNLQQHVDIAGFVSEADKPQYLASADVAVFPSISGESFGIVLIEAMAAGAKVVMGGDNPGYSSVLGQDHGVLFDPNNVEAFGNVIEQFLKNKSRSDQVHAYQRVLVKQYDIEVVGPKVHDIYKTAIAKHHQNI